MESNSHETKSQNIRYQEEIEIDLKVMKVNNWIECVQNRKIQLRRLKTFNKTKF